MEKWQAIKKWQRVGIVILLCIIVGGMYVYKNMVTVKDTGFVNSSVQSNCRISNIMRNTG